MKPAEYIKNLFKKAEITVSPDTDSRILTDALNALEASDDNRPTENIWSTIMKSKMTKLAAAAMIIVAIGISFIAIDRSATPAWADIIQPILDAKNAVMEIVVGDENNGAPVIQDEIMGSRIRRTVAGIDAVTIIDLETLKILSLDHDEKQATFIDLKGLPKIPNYLETIKTLLTEIQTSPGFYTEDLPEQLVDGINVYGIRAFHPSTELTIWVDAETDLPTRIDQQGKQVKVICRNIQFDVPMDESMFSMDVPDGYKQHQHQLDLTGATEEQFLDYLRILTEIVYDGVFPEDISIEYYVKQVPLLKEKFDALDISDEEKSELGAEMSQGLMFIRFFKGQGKWYYRGSGVKLGDAETPIFWYHPRGSETWRIIYGDLHAEDVAEEDLPEAPEQKTQKQGVKYQQWIDSKFVGKEVDTWHITADGEVEAHSNIELLKGPKDVSTMPIILPYKQGKIVSVTINDQAVEVREPKSCQYEIDIPLLDGQNVNIECIWTMPLDTLEKVDYGFRTKLQGLIYITSYKLSIVIDPDCGYENTNDPASDTLVPFFGNWDDPKMSPGSCGIMITEIK
ncbi:MAG: hypothetical protein KAJ07_07635 [Planctomycetes bacterium]|nr:hypothetical protein [Planctomycetota bacterium]